MSVAVTEGSGKTIAADVVGSAAAPSAGQQVQYAKIDGGGAGLSAPVENATAANLAAQAAAKALLTSRPGQWAATHAPAANTQATASKAAGGAGVRHVCTGVSINLAAGGSAPTATQLTVNLRDGATGAGTILATWTIAIPAVAGEFKSIQISDLNIPGTANTAMTLEFTAGGGANTYESVTLFGTDAS